MKKFGYEFSVVTSHGNLDLPDIDEYDSIPVHRFRFQSSLENKDVEGIFSSIKRLKEVKEKFKPDIVHINFTDPSIFFHFKTNNSSQVKTVVSFRLSVENNATKTNSLLLRTLENADWITASSKAIMDEVIRLNPEVEQYSSVIYPSLEKPVIEPSQVSFSPPVLLCFGRIVNEKGFDLAIDAVSIVSQKYPEIKLMIAGDGPAKDELINKTKESGIENMVDFLGWINPDEIPEVINKSSIVIVPSRWKEAFGQVALQAMHMGRPVIAADTGGLKEIIDNKINGILVGKENPSAIAEAVTFLIENKEYTLNLGLNGKKTAQEKFSWDNNINSFNRLYKYLGG